MGTLAASPVFAADPAKPAAQSLPRFASTNSPEVNVRYGPGMQYPVRWKLLRRGLPVKVIEEDREGWRRIVDHDGDDGWVSSGLLTSKRTVMLRDTIQALRRTPDEGAPIVVRGEAGVIGSLLECGPGWCLVDISGRRGWVQSTGLWGILPGDLKK